MTAGRMNVYLGSENCRIPSNRKLKNGWRIIHDPCADGSMVGCLVSPTEAKVGAKMGVFVSGTIFQDTKGSRHRVMSMRLVRENL